MVGTAAHLADHVFPRLPVRQWVLSVPKRLRYFIQCDGAVLNMVARIFLRVIAQSPQAYSPGAANVDIRHVLDHIGVESKPPRITPAGGPPLWDEIDAQVDEGVNGEPDWVLAAQPAPDFDVDQRVNW
jgi:hypothetical protein